MAEYPVRQAHAAPFCFSLYGLGLALEQVVTHVQGPIALSNRASVRVIPPECFGKYPRQIDFEALLVGRGYSPVPAGGSGGTILMHPTRNLVWKIANDPATQTLCEMMLIAPADPALPRVFAVADPTAPYSVIAMEKLAPFPQHGAWSSWLEADFQATRGSPATDPFSASATLHWLLDQIRVRGGQLDVQAKNVLLRRGTQQIVFFDPVY